MKRLSFWIALVLVIVLANVLFLTGLNPSQRNPKMELIGNTVVLRYSEKKDTYHIEGIDEGSFH